MNRFLTNILIVIIAFNIQCKSNTVTPKQVNNIEETDGGNENDENVDREDGNDIVEEENEEDGNYNYPFVILNLNKWKLNAFQGDLNNLEYVDRIQNLPTYSNENWFFSSAENWVTFKCYAGFPTSNNSGNPRTELRELEDDGQTNSYWDGNIGYHSMEWEFRVDQLPSSGKLCFGQIHGPSDTYDDVIRVQFQGNKNQGEGEVRLKVMGWVTEENGDKEGDFLDGDWQLDQVYRLQLIFENENLILYEIKEEKKIEIYRFEGCNSSKNYFKAGLYMQSMQNKTFDLKDYGQVSMSYLSVTHQ